MFDWLLSLPFGIVTIFQFFIKRSYSVKYSCCKSPTTLTASSYCFSSDMTTLCCQSSTFGYFSQRRMKDALLTCTGGTVEACSLQTQRRSSTVTHRFGRRLQNCSHLQILGRDRRNHSFMVDNISISSITSFFNISMIFKISLLQGMDSLFCQLPTFYLFRIRERVWLQGAVKLDTYISPFLLFVWITLVFSGNTMQAYRLASLDMRSLKASNVSATFHFC